MLCMVKMRREGYMLCLVVREKKTSYAVSGGGKEEQMRRQYAEYSCDKEEKKTRVHAVSSCAKEEQMGRLYAVYSMVVVRRRRREGYMLFLGGIG
jgi:hypothetical protein